MPSSFLDAVAHAAAAKSSSSLPSLPSAPSEWAPSARPEWGDVSCASALRLAKAVGLKPGDLAEAWATALHGHPWVAAAHATPSGHLNLTLSPAGWEALLAASAEPPAVPQTAAPVRTLVEFVSANPTGPLHVGHARQAVLGDALVGLLRAQGHPMETEFFHNDAGAQVSNLLASVQARWAELHGRTTLRFLPEDAEPDAPLDPPLGPGERLFPADGYRGDYVIELARLLPAPRQASDPEPPAEAVRAVVLPAVQAEQTAALDRLGVHFDHRMPETALHDSGAVASVLARWQGTGAADGEDGKLWLRTTRWGDDKDRVALKADGSTTYFVPDVAYHEGKWQRGFARALNIQGADHHGTLARVRAGLQALDEGIPANYPEVRFHTMVKVVRSGVPVKTSKRAGGYTTLDELLDAVGPVALRLLLLQKKADSPLVLDLDAALRPTPDNPAYTIQYAHARACALLERLDASSAPAPASSLAPPEKALLAAQLAFAGALALAAQREEPHRAVAALVALAHAVHAAYQQGPKAHTMAPADQALRARLFEGARQALAVGAGHIGAVLPRRLEPVETAAAQASARSSGP